LKKAHGINKAREIGSERRISETRMYTAIKSKRYHRDRKNSVTVNAAMWRPGSFLAAQNRESDRVGRDAHGDPENKV
jgi:hypothetical protein